MKKEVHPALNRIVFVDTSTNRRFPSWSTMTSAEKQVIDGETYYVVHCPVTSDSHPAYTGQSRMIDTAGRVEKFNKRYAKKK
ncbi:MAG: type B 50S ribosomal protein L31 [Bdellovibrionaceae bacterium]|nr:type B 50S ribosomal protein L31 [Pseudobdellovibrionaceae bacterium]